MRLDPTVDWIDPLGDPSLAPSGPHIEQVDFERLNLQILLLPPPRSQAARLDPTSSSEQLDFERAGAALSRKSSRKSSCSISSEREQLLYKLFEPLNFPLDFPLEL